MKNKYSLFQDAYDIALPPKLPVIISLNIRGAFKATSLLSKPFDINFHNYMIDSANKLVSEVEGTVLCYTFGDEITLICKNDQNINTTPWYDNKIQKLSSITASLATLGFNTSANANESNLITDIVFLSNVFIVSNYSDAVNYIVQKQQQSIQKSLYFACFYELLKKEFNKNDIKDILFETSSDDKINILKQECNIDYNSYSLIFKKGALLYKKPIIIDEIIKNRWVVNNKLPTFVKDNEFLLNIIETGNDTL